MHMSLWNSSFLRDFKLQAVAITMDGYKTDHRTTRSRLLEHQFGSFLYEHEE